MLEAEARRSKRSVAAVIREAIDWRFASDARVRAGAARRFLAATELPEGVEPDWADTKALIAGATKLESSP